MVEGEVCRSSGSEKGGKVSVSEHLSVDFEGGKDGSCV